MIVRRAGDVIPEVVGPVLSKRPKGARPWKFPTTCPSCGTPLVRERGRARTGGARTSAAARSQNVEWLFSFASRGAMDIERLGYKTGIALLDRGLGRGPGRHLLADRRAAGAAAGVQGEDDREPAGGDRGVEGPAALAAAGRAEHPPRRLARRPGAGAGVPVDRRARRRPPRRTWTAVEGIGPEIAASVIDVVRRPGRTRR